MNVARVSRGDNPRWLWQARTVASTAGTLFIRTYERGERVHLAMLSRGYEGHASACENQRAARPSEWVAALAPTSAAAVVLLAAITV
jgi:cobalt/nickel transport system permease protein